MIFRFDPTGGLIIVSAEVVGPAASGIFRLALDTGATRTVVNAGLLVALGYDPAATTDRIEMTTGSGVEYAPLVVVQEFTALGVNRTSLPVLAHTLPPSAGVDGLLGVDFFRDRRLIVDFRQGILETE